MCNKNKKSHQITDKFDENFLQAEKSTIHTADVLLAWYEKEKRILPWREDTKPYHIWISEIMLQQTRVEAVKEYYARFLQFLPDVQALAEAEEDTYLKLWEGLGYYSRVRNLHKAAVMIMNEYGGQFPDTADELKKLPGIGDYTSAAIASIAYKEAVPAIDGNLLRVFARLTAYGNNIKDKEAKAAAEVFYLSEISSENPGDYNQALMDLGATVCLPTTVPLCGQCPLKDKCKAHEMGKETEFPIMPVKKERKTEELTVFLIHYKDRIALRKRPAKGLLAGLYEYPNTEGHLTFDEAAEYVKSIGFEPVRLTGLPEAKHIFTHREWFMNGYDVLAAETQEKDESDGVFMASMSEIRTKYSIPSAYASFTERIVPD